MGENKADIKADNETYQKEENTRRLFYLLDLSEKMLDEASYSEIIGWKQELIQFKDKKLAVSDEIEQAHFDAIPDLLRKIESQDEAKKGQSFSNTKEL